MADEIRPIEGFSSMRPMSPYYGGADLTVPSGIPSAYTGAESYPSEPQIPEFAYATEPAQGGIAGVGGMNTPVAAPDQKLSNIMKLLDDPKYHKEFCAQFKDYINEVNPNERLMTPSGAAAGAKAPHMGRGLPMVPGLNKSSSSSLDKSGTGSLDKAGSQIGDDINLTGSVDDRISQLQNAISQLESRKGELETQIQQLEAEIQQIQAQIQELENQKKEIESQREQKQQELNQAKQEQQKLKEQKSQLMARRDELGNQKQALSGSIQNLTAQITQLTGQITSMKATAASMHGQAAALLANPYTAAAGAALEAQAAAIDAQVMALEAQKAQLMVQKQQDECQLSQVEAQISQINGQINQISPQLEAVDNKVKMLENELAQIDEKINQLDQKIAQLKDQENEKKKQIADKRSELAQIKVKIEKMKKSLDDHIAYKNKQGGSNQTQSGKSPKAEEMIAALSAMAPKPGLGNLGDGSGILGGLAGKGILGGRSSGEGSSQKAERAANSRNVASPGGKVDMRAIKSEPSQQVSQFGPNPTQEQVGQMLEETALKYGIPQDVMKAVAWNDSKFDSKSKYGDGEIQGAVNVAPDLNPDYDVARGNRNPAYNIEQGGKGIRSEFEKTSDWKLAISNFYGGGSEGSAIGSGVMDMAMTKPWEGIANNANMMQTPKRG